MLLCISKQPCILMGMRKRIMKSGVGIQYLPAVRFQVLFPFNGSVAFELPIQSCHMCLFMVSPLLGTQLVAMFQHHHVGRVIDPKCVPTVLFHVIVRLLGGDHSAFWQDFERAKGLLGVVERQSVDISGLVLDCSHHSRLSKRLAEDAEEQKAAAVVSLELEILQEDLFQLDEREVARPVEVFGHRTRDLSCNRTRR